MTPSIAIVGGGLGGSTAGVLLQRAGFQVDVYEQAAQIQRIGAGIHLQTNTMRVMEAAGLADSINAIGIQPKRWLSREWDTGRIVFEPKTPAGWVVVHRGDLLEIFIAALKPGTFHSGKRLIEVEERGSEVELTFADNSKVRADVVIGADGINSRVRELLLGPEDPHYSGFIAYRSIFSASLVRDCVMSPDWTTKWWSDARHWDPTHIRYFMTYYLSNASDEIYFVTGAPDPDWKGGTQPVPASKDELRACYAGFHSDVQSLIEACTTVSKWPIFDREPLPLWSRGQIVLLGDACHPMAPYMGQGAGMAIEDAAVLMRCLQEASDPARAFEVYRTNRIERTSLVQKVSHDHTWLAYPQDTEWVWGYDATSVPLAGLANAA